MSLDRKGEQRRRTYRSLFFFSVYGLAVALSAVAECNSRNESRTPTAIPSPTQLRVTSTPTLDSLERAAVGTMIAGRLENNSKLIPETPTPIPYRPNILGSPTLVRL